MEYIAIKNTLKSGAVVREIISGQGTKNAMISAFPDCEFELITSSERNSNSDIIITVYRWCTIKLD